MDPCPVDNGSWTDEKHSHFLDFLETSFLHTMFGAGSVGGGEYGRLDRELPDICDSTRDSGQPQIPRRRRKTHLSEGMSKPKKSARWSSSASRHRVDDQVVPQHARRWGGEEDDVEEIERGQKDEDVGPKPKRRDSYYMFVSP